MELLDDIMEGRDCRQLKDLISDRSDIQIKLMQLFNKRQIREDLTRYWSLCSLCENLTVKAKTALMVNRY